MVEKKTEIATLTIVFRKTDEIGKMFNSDWFLKCNAPDRFIKLYTTFVSGKSIYIMPETMSCYRVHSGGIWSSLKPKSLRQKELSDLYLIIRIFNYSWNQKIKLFFLYMKKYFLFEVKERSLQQAFNTMRAIL